MEQYRAASQNTDTKLRALLADIEAVRQKSKILEDRYSSLFQRRRDLVSRHGGANISDSDQIHLNVGGTRMYALRETLVLIKGSRLEVLFSGRWEDKLLRDEEGRVFLDIDPVIFKRILEHLCLMKIQSNKNLPWPSMSDQYEQNSLDIYLDFFRLNKETTDDKESEKSAIEMDVSPNVLAALKREKDELDLDEDRLQTLEHKLEEEEGFISLFVLNTIVLDDPEEIRCSAPATQSKGDEDEARNNEDVISFASMDSDLQSMNEVSSIDSSTTIHSHSSPPSDALNRILKLWIDGEIVYVKHFTMCCIQDSLLAQSFNSASWIKKHSFINEDGARVILIEHASVFKAIINQLRLQFMVASNDQLPVIKHDHMLLLESVVSKLFKGKEDHILPKMYFDSSIIVQNSEQTQMVTWLKEASDVKKSYAKLIYRASQDGWDVDDLHRHCDDKGAVFVVVKTTKGYVFGGYMDGGIVNRNPDAFLFSLKCHAGLPPTKMKLKRGEESYGYDAFCNDGYILGFGRSGDDLTLFDQNFTDIKKGRASIGGTYDLPVGSNSTFLTGSSTSYFDVAEVEVFQV